MSTRQTLTLANDLAEVSRMAEFIDAFCETLQPAPSQKDLLSIHLSLEEIVTNVINHGYADHLPHAFTLELDATAPGRIRAVVTDDARAYDPLARAEVDTSLPLEDRPIGGLGVHLVKKLMDVSHYERREGKNIFTIERVLNRAA